MNPISPPLTKDPPGKDHDYRKLLDASLAKSFRQALRIVAAEPALALTGMQILARTAAFGADGVEGAARITAVGGRQNPYFWPVLKSPGENRPLVPEVFFTGI